MEIPLTVEQEAQLSAIAAMEGKGVDELAREVLLRGLRSEANLVAARDRGASGEDTVARMFELRRGNMLPDGVSVQDLIREGRA